MPHPKLNTTPKPTQQWEHIANGPSLGMRFVIVGKLPTEPLGEITAFSFPVEDGTLDCRPSRDGSEPQEIGGYTWVGSFRQFCVEFRAATEND